VSVSDRVGLLLIGVLVIGGVIMTTMAFRGFHSVLVLSAGTAMLLGWWARWRGGAAPGVRRLGDALWILAGVVAAFYVLVRQ
jgi:hypothetical protein